MNNFGSYKVSRFTVSKVPETTINDIFTFPEASEDEPATTYDNSSPSDSSPSSTESDIEDDDKEYQILIGHEKYICKRK